MTPVSSSTSFASTSFSSFPLELAPMSPTPPLSPTLPDSPLSSLQESTQLPDSSKIPLPSQIDTPKDNNRSLTALHPTQSSTYTTTAKTMEISAPPYVSPTTFPMTPLPPITPISLSLPDLSFPSPFESTTEPHTPFTPRDLFQIPFSEESSYLSTPPSVYSTTAKTFAISRSQSLPSYASEKPIQQTKMQLKVTKKIDPEGARIQCEISLCQNNIVKYDKDKQKITNKFNVDSTSILKKIQVKQSELETIRFPQRNISEISLQTKSPETPCSSTAEMTHICTSTSITSPFCKSITSPISISSSCPTSSIRMSWRLSFLEPLELNQLTSDPKQQKIYGQKRWNNLFESDFQNKWGTLAFSYAKGYDWDTVNQKYFKFESITKLKQGCEAFFNAVYSFKRDDHYLETKFSIPEKFIPYLRAFAIDQITRNSEENLILKKIKNLKQQLIEIEGIYNDRIDKIELNKTVEITKVSKLLDDLKKPKTTKRKIEEVSKKSALPYQKETKPVKKVATAIQSDSCSSSTNSLPSKSKPPFAWTLEIPEEISDQLSQEAQIEQGKKNWENKKWEIIAWSLFKGDSRRQMDDKYFKDSKNKVYTFILKSCKQLFDAIKKGRLPGQKFKNRFKNLSPEILPYLEKFADDPLPK